MDLPRQNRCHVLRCPMESEMLGGPHAAIELDTRLEVLAAEDALIRRGQKREWTADGRGVAKLPRISRQVLLGNIVSGDIPAVEIARQNQLEVQFSISV